MLAVSREPCLTGMGSRFTVDEEGRDANVSAKDGPCGGDWRPDEM